MKSNNILYPRSQKKVYKVYKIINTLVNEIVYIGQTKKTIQERFKIHCKSKYLIGKMIRLYKKENFIIQEIVSNLTLKQANKFERLYIKEFNTLAKNGIGYNISDGGQYVANPFAGKSKSEMMELKKKFSKRTKEKNSRYVTVDIFYEKTLFKLFKSGYSAYTANNIANKQHKTNYGSRIAYNRIKWFNETLTNKEKIEIKKLQKEKQKTIAKKDSNHPRYIHIDKDYEEYFLELYNNNYTIRSANKVANKKFNKKYPYRVMLNRINSLKKLINNLPNMFYLLDKK